MSHTVTIELEIKSLTALRCACSELGYSFVENEEVQMYDGKHVRGAVVRMPGWMYPVVAKDNKLHYDNYNGSWGDIGLLTKLRQRYSINVQKEVARQKGYRVRETVVGGRVRLTAER